MTAFFRPLAVLSAVIVPLAAASVASADSYDHDYRYRHRYDHGRNVVHAPFTRVESGRRTVVDAPFVHVYDGRHGTHVVAPFVDLWR